MLTIYSVNDLQQRLDEERADGRVVGLVPTMGALHAGHASLVERSLSENDVTVVSIFLNPTQFNDPKDLERYPKTLEADCALLQALVPDGKVLIAFAPSVAEVYPEPDRRVFSYPPTDAVMEGARRPGHFNGVCQVVSRLFDMVKPTRASFGEKDFQQIAVIRRMVDDLKFDIDIVPCPVVREESGLAMSSRNTLLTPDERQLAAHIYAVLKQSKDWAKTMSVQEVEQAVVREVNAFDGLDVEYYSIVNGNTLLPADNWQPTDGGVVGCITVFCGSTPIRLIDHIRYI